MSILFFIVLIDLVGFGVVIPLLPFYAERFHATPQVVGMAMATYSLGQLIAAPYWGRLSDRIGRRPVLLASLAGTAVAYLWLGFADALWMLFGARALGGLMAGNLSAAFAYVADVTPPARRARGMGMIGAAFGLGFILGPAIGGLLAGADPVHADFRTPALLAAGLSATALGIAFFILRESLSPEIRALIAARPRRNHLQNILDLLGRPRVGVWLLLSFLSTFVFAGMESTFALWSERRFGWGPLQNGYLFAAVGIFSAAIQGGLIGRLAKRFGEKRLVVQGAAALAAGLGLVPFSSGLPLLALGMGLMAYGFSLLTPSLNSLLSLQVGPEEQGSTLGVARSATTLARVVGPPWAGFLFGALGRDWPYFAGAGLMFCVAVLAFRSGQESSNRPPAAAASSPASRTESPAPPRVDRQPPSDAS